jgi:predicted nucleotidyltransferase
MSIDERTLARIAALAKRIGLEFVVVGNSAAALHDVPLMTLDVDLFVRHTPQNLQKIRRFAELAGGSLIQPYDPLSRMMRLIGPDVEVPVDFVFDLSSRKKFESVRSRAVRMKLGQHVVLVAALEDVIAAKEAAARPKDLSTLPLLKEALRKQQIERERKR